MPTYRILAAIIDTRYLTLYRDNGDTIKIQQGDVRLAPFLEAVKPLDNPVANNLPTITVGVREYPYVDIEVEDGKIKAAVPDTVYSQYEEKSKKGGLLTRFFKVAKNKVAHLLTGEPVHEETPEFVAPMAMGTIPDRMTIQEAAIIKPEPKLEDVASSSLVPETIVSNKVNDAIDQIMAHAVSMSDPNLPEEELNEQTHSVVAITEDAQGNKAIIPEAHHLKDHLAHAVSLDNTQGMEALLKRLGALINKRGHTVDDLLRFLKRGDLPVANDGMIIAYKVLQSNGDCFVDCHTRKVKQKVGSFVCQDESLIDPSRSTQCSTGLHIARRAYLKGFSGDVIVMIKFAPEDVIAVPVGEPDKIRVKGYHILAKIPFDEHATLRSNEPMKGTNALKLLTMAIQGDHIGITEEVRITAAKGGSFIVTPMETDRKTVSRPTKDVVATPVVTVQEKPKPAPAPVLEAPVVDPKTVMKEAQEAKKLSANQYARELYADGKITELKEYKRKAKKSWHTLGFTMEEETLLNGQPVFEPKKEEAPMTEKVSLKGTRAEVARTLFDQACAGDKTRWKTLWIEKKQAKKSWETLGFTAKEIERINTNKPDGI